MRKRIFGLETEYSLVYWDSGRDALLTGNEVDRMVNAAAKELGFQEFLENGGRFYIDRGSHPEYATPECASVTDVIKYDKAGEMIVEKICRYLNEKCAGKGIFYIHKDNSDRKGDSFGCHENYLVKIDNHRFEVWMDRILPILLTFLATRQIFCGTGKIGRETIAKEPQIDDRHYPFNFDHPASRRDLKEAEGEIHPDLAAGDFQISQRADFLETGRGSANVNSKCFVCDKTDTNNHCDTKHYRRLHITCGDSNMSEYSAFLKIATTAAVLAMLEEEFLTGTELEAPIIADPVSAVKEISRDPSLKNTLRLRGGGEMTAVAIQNWFLEKAREFRTTDEEAVELKWLSEWSDTLEKLENNPKLLKGKIDWLIKRDLILRYKESRDLDWSDAAVLSLDVEYHNIEKTKSIYYFLEQTGEVLTLIDASQIEYAISNPPPDTRAALRAAFVKMGRNLGIDKLYVRWDGLGETSEDVKMKNPFELSYSEAAKLLKVFTSIAEELKFKQKKTNIQED